MSAIAASAAGAAGSSGNTLNTSGGSSGTAGFVMREMMGGNTNMSSIARALQAARGKGQSRSSNAITQAQQAAQQAQAAVPELSPEEQAIQKMNAEGGTAGNVSVFGNMKNGVNSNFNAQVAGDQKEFESQQPAELANPLGTPLEPMGAVGSMASAVTGGVLPQNGSPFTGQAQMNAGQMFGQTYGDMFAGASKK